jgi:RimJ/RimL family protein N-acetyltransferase
MAAMVSAVEIRPVLDTDLPTFFEFHVDEGANYMAAFTAKDPSDRVAFDSHMAKIFADPSCILRTVLVEGQIVGSVGKFFMFGMPQVTYRIGRQYWGRGIATASLLALLNEYTERPIYAAAAFDNVASIRVLTKCGFEEIRRETGYANARGQEIEEIIFKLEA